MTEDDNYVITASYDKHALTVWRRNVTTGSLAVASTVKDGDGDLMNGGLFPPHAMANDGLFHPHNLALSGKYLYVASSSWCRHINDGWAWWCQDHDDALAVYELDSSSGRLAFIESHERRAGYSNSECAKRGEKKRACGATELFLSHPPPPNPTPFSRIFAVEDNNGVLVSKNGSLVFLASKHHLTVFSRNQVNGRLTREQILNKHNAAFKGLAQYEDFLYAASNEAMDISLFRLAEQEHCDPPTSPPTPATLTLSPALCQPPCSGNSLPVCNNGACVASCPSNKSSRVSSLLKYEGYYTDYHSLSLDDNMKKFRYLAMTKDGKYLYATASSWGSEKGWASYE